MASDSGLGVQGADRWNSAIGRLPMLLDELRRASKLPANGRLGLPNKPGVYLFSEHGRPIYVGQTRTLRRRYDQHTGANRGHNQASFAFLLARAAAASAGIPVSGTRAALEGTADFLDHFKEAKARVARMDFQFVQVDDPVQRSLFEIYAAIHLGTERYNSFETH